MNLKKSNKAISFVLIILILMLTGLGCTPSEGKDDWDTLVTTNYGHADQLDPAFAYNGGIIQILHVYETLISFNKEKVDEFIPVLATEIPTVENGGISDDGMTYTFTIRDGVKFTNGNTLTAEDVEYSFERMLVVDPDQGPVWMLYQPFLDSYGSRDWDTGDIVYNATDLQDIVQVSGNKVIFNLAKPFPPFLQLLSLSTGAVLDKEWCVQQGCWDGSWTTWEDANNPEVSPIAQKLMGTGRYKLEKLTAGEEVVMVENTDYWGDQPSIKRIHWMFVDEWSTRKQMFLQGDIDVLGAQDPAEVEQLKGADGVTIHEGLPATTTHTMVFNFNIDPNSDYIGSGALDGNGIPTDFFNDTNVRLGFAHSFPVDDYIADVRLGQGIQMATCLPNNMPFHNPNQAANDYDPTKAEEYFKLAFNGEVWTNGFKIEIPYDIEDAEGQSAIQMLADELSDINDAFVITEKGIETTSFYDMVDVEDPCPAPIRVDGWWWPDFADPDNYFAGAYLGSWGYYSWNMYISTSEIEALLAEGTSTLDEDERKDVYYEIQKLYVDEALGIPVIQVIDNYVLRDWVKGFYYRPLWQDVNFYWDFELEPEEEDGLIPGFTLIASFSILIVIVYLRKSRKP